MRNPNRENPLNNSIDEKIYTHTHTHLNNLVIELDALSIALLMNNTTTNLLMEPLLTDCRNLREIPNKQITHVFREANQCVDALAKLGASSLSSFVVFLNPSHVVESIIVLDKANLRCNRLINS